MFETLTAWLTMPLQRHRHEPAPGQPDLRRLRHSAWMVLRSVLFGAVLVSTPVVVGLATVYAARLVDGTPALVTIWMLGATAVCTAPTLVVRAFDSMLPSS